MRNTVKQKIEELLSIPQHYLMYKGGAGGEFLAGQIYQYSNKFKNPYFKTVTNNELNRTYADATDFHRYLNSIPFNKLAKLDFVDGMTDIILNNHSDPINLLDTSLDTLNQIRRDGYQLLFRVHEWPHNYFYNKTFLIFTLRHKWRHYWLQVLHVKRAVRLSSIKQNVKFGIRVDYNVPTLNEFLEYCDENNMTEVNELLFKTAIKYRFNKQQITNLFNTPLSQIYTEECDSYAGNSEDYFLYSKTFDFDNYRNVCYHNFFDKGYLEGKFEIDSNQFHDNLLEWHENNLQLLSKNKFDIKNFKI